MRVVIHAGMHKTGTSSIQDYFLGNSSEDFVYARWTDSNHCGLFILLFEELEKLSSYHGFRARGPDFVASLPKKREKWLRSLKEDMERSAGKTLIFSAEDISAPQFRYAVTQMNEFFRQWTDDITVVGYARKPLSFAMSAFQQILKDGGLKTINLNVLWPHYQQRFSMLEEIFGRDHVILRAYDRQNLVGNDVIRDFGAVAGVEIKGTPAPESNVSLSAEAIAILFTQRSLGDGYVAGFNTAQAGNNAFVDKLRKIGSGKLAFSEEAWNPVLEKNSADLLWIESRIGLSMREVADAGSIKISTDNDLIQLATRSYHELESLLIQSIKESSVPAIQKTVRAADLLRKLSYY